MEFEINTKDKTICITANCNLKNLIDLLKKMLNDDWKDYEIVSKIEYKNWWWTYPTYYTTIPCSNPYEITFGDTTAQGGIYHCTATSNGLEIKSLTE